MVNKNEVIKTNVICERINFVIKREKVVPHVEFTVSISANWGIVGIRQDNQSLKLKIIYSIKSDVLDGEIEITITADFNRALTQEEISSKDTHKICAISSAVYITQWIADISSKMGISPVIIPPEVIINMINAA